MSKLSVLIHTKNVAETLAKTLKSVQFADEVIVVDMASTDETLAIAKKYKTKIYHHEDLGYADPARNFAISKAQYDWILVVDADEVVKAELKEIILKTINDDHSADIYHLPRKNYVFGKWIMKTGWWPDYQPRLFKKGAVSWQVGVHRLPDMVGTQAKLPAEEKYALEHANYIDIAHFLTKLNHYTSIQAKERLASSPKDDFSSSELFEVFANELAKRSLMMNGFEEGLHGVSLSFLQANYEAIIYLKQWGELGYKETKPEDFAKILDKMQQIWRYWWADYQVRHNRGLSKIYWQIRRKLKV
ncbi:MAG: glycosyltransferase family 2 protein [Candidatus Pacebacteria bacterium]|nr:glycosyltransferase family 2 protein [Candidatus Paceibacterota bacterium]